MTIINRKSKGKQQTEISGCEIIWWVESKKVTELDDFETERIEDLLRDGFTSGELNVSYTGENGRHYETSGWWEKVNWKSIALELYNAIGDKTKEAQAKKRFDENW